MARRSRAGDSSGWAAALGGALLLVALGFLLGMAAGIAIEVPGLVGSTEVPFAPGGAKAPSEASAVNAANGAGIAGRAESPGRGSRPGRPARPAAALAADAPLGEPAVRRPPRSAGTERSARAAAPAARRSAPAAAPPVASAGRFSVQVGAFAEADSARGVADALQADGVPVQVVDTRRGSAPYKVRVGPLATRAEAQRMAKRLQRERALDTWVVAGERR